MSRQRINSIVVTFLLVVLLGVIAFCGFMRLVSETRENMSSEFEEMILIQQQESILCKCNLWDFQVVAHI